MGFDQFPQYGHLDITLLLSASAITSWTIEHPPSHPDPLLLVQPPFRELVQLMGRPQSLLLAARRAGAPNSA
jgi:hypothetical protein